MMTATVKTLHRGRRSMRPAMHSSYSRCTVTIRGAYILCVYGIMTDRLYPYVQKAVELYRQKTGDERITALHIEPHTDEAGYGADWHPSKLTHIRAAKEVTAKINSLNKKC